MYDKLNFYLKIFPSRNFESESENHSVVRFETPWTIQSMEFSRSEYWSLSLLPRIFPTQGLNPGLPHCRRILSQLSHKGSPEAEIQIKFSNLTIQIK